MKDPFDSASPDPQGNAGDRVPAPAAAAGHLGEDGAEPTGAETGTGPEPAAAGGMPVKADSERGLPASSGTMQEETRIPRTIDRPPAWPPAQAAPRYRRRRLLPLMLFLATCGSTFFVGCHFWSPAESLASLMGQNAMPARLAIVSHWQDGLVYMACLVGILLAHEMGHFLATVYYGIPASFPFFLPVPFTPFGTMGAVIGMDGRLADRKQIFDIGIAGPLAGLVIAVPVMCLGVWQLEVPQEGRGGILLGLPLLVQWMLALWPPENYYPDGMLWLGYTKGNPYFVAGWFGLLITGVNMVPVSQLDGGHVVYTVFGRWGRLIARTFIAAVILFVLLVPAARQIWAFMIMLVILLGVDHPPTRDDRVPLGWFRAVLGTATLSLPLLCLPPVAIRIL